MAFPRFNNGKPTGVSLNAKYPHPAAYGDGAGTWPSGFYATFSLTGAVLMMSDVRAVTTVI
jgi:hypothetical protein